MSALLERNPDISIIIPVYNLERFLDPMIRSLACQNLSQYTAEIIFVLNNCTDNSEQVILDSGLPCQILNCTTQGCGPARNTGLDIATGTYIWMLDGDDWLTSFTAIRDVLDKAYTEDLDILRITFDSNMFHWPYFSMVWQYIFRHDFIREFRFPDFQPGEDDAYMTEVLAKAGYNGTNYTMLPCIATPLYYYNYNREGSNMYRFNRGERI